MRQLNGIQKAKMISGSETVIRLVFAVLAGGVIGLEREVVHKPAGMRTHMLVSLGSAMFALITFETLPNEVARIIAGVATGVGFLGAGTIFRTKSEVQGLTTAASVWTVAALGLAIGLGYYFIMAVAVVLIPVILHLNKFRFFSRL